MSQYKDKRIVFIWINRRYSFTVLQYMAIRFIDFDRLKSHGSLPRCPDQLDLCSTIDEVKKNRDNSLVVFISHRWLRSDSNLPDDDAGNKYKLIIEGLDKVKHNLCPNVKTMYIWCDFSCIDQDGNKMGELMLLDKIVQICDIMFTPIVDEVWSSHTYNIGSGWLWTFPADWWCDKKIGYRNRGWCRLEMYLAANEPLLESSPQRIDLFQAGLRSFTEFRRVRAHILYGTYHSKNRMAPSILPPFQNDLYDRLNPLAESAFITKEEDRQYIKALMDRNPRRVVVQEYHGEKNPQGQRHGQGKMTWADGTIYVGSWKNDLKHGQGNCAFANGDVYEGDWVEDMKSGQGCFHFSSGNTYEGGYKEDKRHGHGKLTFAGGNVYEGDWEENKMHGHGRYSYANGDVYEGSLRGGKKSGQGRMSYASGSEYDGNWEEDKKSGQGKYYHSGKKETYEGHWKENMKDGQGTLTCPEGIYEGDWKTDKKDGMGKFTFSNGDIYGGNWKEDKMDGQGRYSFANGDVFEGFFSAGKKNGEGRFTFGDRDDIVVEEVAVMKGGKKRKFRGGSVLEGVWVDDKYTGSGGHLSTKQSACCIIL